MNKSIFWEMLIQHLIIKCIEWAGIKVLSMALWKYPTYPIFIIPKITKEYIMRLLKGKMFSLA